MIKDYDNKKIITQANIMIDIDGDYDWRSRVIPRYFSANTNDVNLIVI